MWLMLRNGTNCTWRDVEESHSNQADGPGLCKLLNNSWKITLQTDSVVSQLLFSTLGKEFYFLAVHVFRCNTLHWNKMHCTPYNLPLLGFFNLHYSRNSTFTTGTCGTLWHQWEAEGGQGLGQGWKGQGKQDLQWVQSFWNFPSHEFEFPGFIYFVGHALIKSEQSLPTWILLWSFLLLFQTSRTPYVPESLSVFYFPTILSLIKDATPTCKSPPN